MASYTKPYYSLSDQLNLLKSRGLQVVDDAAALECLHRNGYYRLSAYWYPFRKIVLDKRTDIFLPDSKFDDAVALYNFDKKFKLILLDALERVEIAARVEIALLLGQRDPFAHERDVAFHPAFSRRNHLGRSYYGTWLQKFDSQVEKSNEEFILHYEAQYGTRWPLPIWIGIELWDFGMLSHAFSGMRNADQIAVSARFSIPGWQLMKSWLRSLNYVRNVIAHHSRLWNSNLREGPSLPLQGQVPGFDALIPLFNVGNRIYSICCILSHFTRIVNPQSPWIEEMKKCVNAFPVMPYASIKNMGFPADWESHSFWR